MKGRYLPILLYILVSPLCLSAEEELELGGREGWSSLSRRDAVTFDAGLGGYEDLVLAEQSYSPRYEELDLLLHFDGTPFRDAAGSYEIEPDHRVRFVPSGKIGRGAAKFERKDGGLSLKPKSGALFGEAPVKQSFSFEFWLYPLHLDEGESVFLWEGQNLLGDRIHLQSIRAYLEKRVLTWDFSRIFFSSDFRPRSISVSGRKKLIPREWHHHLISFDSRTGLLEYRLDGRPEAISYVTDTGGEGGTVHLPYIGKSSEKYLSIGEEFDGKIDELRFTRRAVEEPLLHPYAYPKGVAETELIDLQTFGSRLLTIRAETSTPSETDVFFFYRLYRTIEESITHESEWIPFRPGENLPEETRGRYLELRFELFPDGVGTRSPSLSSVTISYEPNPPPLSPSYVQAVPGDESVTVSWNPTMEEDTAGYLLFYGTEPGVYRGETARVGTSPIDVGEETEIVVEGLENEKVYYFSVATYDSAGKMNRSPLSQEVSARPTPYAEEE